MRSLPSIHNRHDRRGRGKKLTPSAVHQRAEDLGLLIRTPASLKQETAQAAFAALDADVAVVAAYGLILPQAILDAPRHGCLNIHGSILPRWRGAAPVQRAILAGDTETGVTIMQMEAGLDTGAMRAVDIIAVGNKTAGELTRELAELGASLLTHVLTDIDSYPPEPQPDSGVTYAKKIEKAEARIDFSAAARQVERQIRAFNPMPGAFFEHEGERYRILAAETVGGESAPGELLDDALTIACGTGAIRPTHIQRAGKPAMPTDELLRGRSFPKGIKL